MLVNKFLAIASVSALAGLIVGRVGIGTLSINGNAVPTTVINQNGRTFVPIADVAKALNMNLQVSGTTYSLSPAGGADQVQGLSGKIGQTLSCGYATLKVVKVWTADHYQNQFADGSLDPFNPGQDHLVLVQVRVKNATKETMTINYQGLPNSALVDNDEHSYPAYDGPGPDFPAANDLLPGSAKDFVLAYMVPKTEKPTQLVYGVSFGQLFGKTQMFRIDLNP